MAGPFTDIWESLQNAAQDIKGNISDATRKKTDKLIDDWLEIFPQLEVYGLRISSFSLSLALSPALRVELLGKHEDWPLERLDRLVAESKGKTALNTVLSTMRTTYRLHRKTSASLESPLIVTVIVRITPEVRVTLGVPRLESGE
ncbi:MAG: hypothetical protein AAF433_01600 [Bacteroidota bacterium]